METRVCLIERKLKARTARRRILVDERGSSLIEYLLVAGLVALGALGGVRAFGASAGGQAVKLGDKVKNLEGVEAAQGDGDGARAGDEPRWHFPFGAHSSDKKKGVALTPITKPDPKLPDAYNHPPSSDLDGKCGITGVSNMLRFYGVEKDPGDIDRRRYRSWGPGLRSDKFADNMKELSGKDFESKTVPDGTDALGVLRGHLDEGKPVAIQYMTSPTDAHWVVVTGVRESADGPVLTVQSWGSYHEVKWSDIDSNWKRGYGGPYPHVVGTESSALLPKRKK